MRHTIHRRIAAIASMAVCAMCADAATFDFETGDLQGWKVVQGSFEVIVSDRAKEHHSGRPYVKNSKWFLSTLETRSGKPIDTQTGVVESPTVRLAGPKITFWVGGGSNGAHFALIDRATGRELARAAGANAQPMRKAEWNVPAAVGKDVFFRVVDEGTSGWGHITVDDITFDGTVGAADFDDRSFLPPEAVERAEKAIRELGELNAAYPAAAHLAALRGIVTGGGRDKAKKLSELLRQALVRDNPLLAGFEMLYVTHEMWRRDHHNTATIFQCGEINQNSYRTQGALRALDVRTGRRRDLVPEVAGRTVRDPEVDYDGRRVVFSMRCGKEDDYHIYVVNADGTGLAQLTRAKGVSDIDPMWLADGDIVFSSTREPKYCMCNRHIMCNLFRMKPDGANIHQIGKSTLFEGHSAMLPDGRVLYDRWEYVDRNFGDAQGLWVCNPDGTRHAIYWGNNTTSPGGVVNARPLSSASQVIAVLGSCHDRPWGALGIIDRSLGVDGREPVLRTWPASYREKIHAGGREDFDSTRVIALKYADPYPIDDAHFLCARQTGRGDETAIFYLDLHGNEILVAEDAPGCHSPMLLRPSKKPVVQAEQRNFVAPDAPGRFYVQNVYVGTHMQGVKKGAIKALRVVESPEKRSWLPVRGWFGHGEEAAAMNWHSFEKKRILGTVPVEEDGSAYFEVPGNTFVYFQALDAEGKMVQSMRSGAYLQPGELYGCVGCHENRVGDVPKTEKKPLAMLRAPSKLDGSYNLKGLEKGTTPHLYSFQKEVQPVFDRRCVSCHDYGKKDSKINLSGDRGAYFCTSYVDLWARGYVNCIGGGPASIQSAYSWGSHASRLTKTLYGHGKSGITEEERDRVITWMDVNAPYWPTYDCAFGQNFGGRMPITQGEHGELVKLTGVKIANSHRARQREQLNFDRPELSRILDPVKGKPQYDKALAIIKRGKDRLKTTPRADMDGFVPCEADRAREERYQRRLAQERRVYDAIRSGRRIYDE